MEKNKTFTAEELEQFVHDHIQQKINNHELALTGVDLEVYENFERDMYIYNNALLEGIINGIIMSGGKVEGIEVE